MKYRIDKPFIILFSTLITILMLFCVVPNTVKAVEYIEMESTSLISWGMGNNDLETGYYKVTVNGITYPIHLYVYEGDQNWTSSMTFGDSSDIGTSSTNAVNSVAVLVKGDLTIASGVTVTTARSNYGGPKGLFLFVTGTLTNSGAITMTQRGAKATGENVYLWQNVDGSYEYVPAVGAAGGAKRTGKGGISTVYTGYTPAAATSRKTGGGGGGGMIANGRTTNSGAGGAGTSYSGGAGGGGAYYGATAGTGSSVGGAGGKGAANSMYTYGAGGGAGNPIGTCVSNCSSATYGTGGLLVIYAGNFANNGSITSNGSKGGNAYRAGGGGSGGGSVNIFYAMLTSKGTVTATGGSYGVGTRKSSERSNGGSGGAGTVTYTELILEEEFLNPTLSGLEVENQTMYPTFDSGTYEYGVTLNSEHSTVNILGELTHPENEITSGVGSFDIPIGTSTHNVVVTSKVGIVQVYSIEFYRPPSSYKYLKDITIDGVGIDGFTPEKLNYDITLPYDYDSFELDVVRGRTSQEVYGTGVITTKSGNNKIIITVVSEDGNYTTNYTLNIYREHSSKLKSLVIDDYNLDPEFDPETNSYTVTIMSTALSVNVDAVAYDEEAIVTLKGFGYVSTSKTGTITVTEPNAGTTTYTINVVKEGAPAVTEYSYGYTGGYQVFTAPATGFYQIELWGAQGGNSVGNNSRTCSYNRGKAYGSGCGGFGAYTSGVIRLNKDDVLYIYVGQRGLDAKAGNNRAGGWNGGGSSTYDHSDNEASGSGGGATDVRLVATSAKTTWNEFASLKSRIMVAAGGGGGSDVYVGGNGGTLTSTKTRFSNIATQTTGYAFGYGENSIYRKSNIDVAGGGSGYFGGYSTAASSGNYGNYGQTGTGGSSYVSGCTGCIAIDESSTSQSNLIFTDSSEHYSGYVFTDIKMIAGGSSMPTTSTGYSVGNVSNGYAKITLVSKSQNNFLSKITIKADGEEKTYTPDYDLETTDYYVELETTETEIAISARPEDSTATISGLGNYDILAGTTDIEITVTAEDGSIRVYTIHVTRPASTIDKPLDIIISGLVPSLCSVNESFCKLNPETFDAETNTYYLTVPSRIKQLYFDVEKAHPYQVIVGEGKVSLDGGENIITIEVSSEDGNSKTSYHYYITRDMTGNTDLSRLEIVDPEREINYDPDITEYYISVPNEYTEIKELIVETDDENASYVITGNENFEPGMNQVYIVVTAANGETKIYVLNVYRERNGNVYLSTLEVKDENQIYELTPEFNKVYLGEYLLTVPNEISTVEVLATPEVSTTTVSGTGTKTLSTGINTYSIITTAEDGSIETYQLSITREKNSNANLSGITVKDENQEYALNPTFDPSVLEYQVEVNEGITSIKIEATAEVDTTIYKLLDSNTIKVGTNIKRVMAIAEDGTTKTYIITIIRPANSNNYLSSLTLTDGEKEYELTPIFDKEETSYTLEVENDVKMLTVTGVPESVLAKVDGNGKYSLAVGDNEITITVKSESGDERTYTVIVTRKPSSNAYLSVITTSSGILVPDFDKETKEYSLNVGSTVDKITITGTPEESTTKVTGNGKYDLVSGENTVTLITLAEDGVTTHTYTIIITKDKSDNANISDLYLEEGVLSPTFDSGIISYTTKVPYDVDQATFHVTLEHKEATYEIIGNENFQVGENEVTIVVTGEDGSTKEYKVVVTRREAPTNSNYLLNLKVSEGILTPIFTKEKQYYEVEVPYEISKLTVSAEAEDEYATVTGLGSYNLKVGANMIVVTVTSYDGVDRDYQIKVTRLKNTDARLANVVISGVTLNPSFDKDITNYSLTTSDLKLAFTKIQPVDSNATYEIIGNEKFVLGANTVIIKVTAQDGVTTKEYSFDVTKNKGNNNNLASLKVEGYTLEPAFDKTTTLYMLTVPNDVKTVNVIATPEDEYATVTGTGSVTIYTGENQLLVEVTSESGNTKSYTILLTREGSKNNLLANLIVNNGEMTPEFDSHTNTYNVTVPYSEEELDLTVVLDDYSAFYEVINNKLKVGSNVVTIMVMSENGDVNNYTLNVTREDFATALLENLEVKNYKLSKEFNSYLTSYDVLIDNEVTSLDLTVTPIDKKATYEIIGNENFVIGTNKVVIAVTSSDGSETIEYILNVTRQAYSNTYLDYLYTSLGDVTPTFDKTILSYTIDVDNSKTSIELIGEAVDKSATVTGLGEHSLSTGRNVFPITVTTTTGIKRTYYVTVNRSKATDNYLQSLEVKTGSTIYTLNPEFDKTINNYTVNVPVGTQSITLSGTISSTATVTGFGTKVVNVGNNVYEIEVTSENGDINTYTVTVIREASSNNYLTDLIPSVGSLQPNFGYLETNYTLNLDSGAGILSFDCATEDTGAKVSGNESQVVPDGQSTRTITVTAEDGSQRVYTITVIKERTDNAKLSSLSVTGYEFDKEFDSDIYEYKIKVPNSKNILLSSEVTAVAQDRNAVITKSGNLNLVTGENEYVITVTAPDGFTTLNYTIVVEREQGSNSLLNNLVVNTGTMSPNFNPNTLKYDWIVTKGYIITPKDLTVEPADAKAKVSMPESLEIINMTGNTYEIKVTSEDGTSTTTYTLNVTYDLSDDNTLKELIIDKGYYLPELNPTIYTYDVYEYVDTTSINISATTSSDNATITSGIGEVTLTEDETVHTIVVTSESGLTQIYTLNIHRSILTDKGLNGLGLNGLEDLECINGKCELSPEFNTDVTNYSIKVPYEYTDLDIYVLKNEQQTVKYKINDTYITEYSLPIGTTTVTIEVYDGMNEKTMEYTMSIERCKSNNTNLSSLKVVDYELEPTFNKGVLEYTVNVPNDVEEVEIIATPEDINSTIRINGYNYLIDGENEATITVTAPDGTQKTYIIHIIKSPLYNSYLKNITVSTGIFWDLTPKFKQTQFEYTTTVSGIYDRVTIEAVPVSSDTVVTGTGEYDVVTGLNTFTLISTATDGSTSIYKINVIKENSKNVNLSNLIVEEGDLTPTFEKGTTSYEVTVDSEVDKLTIHAVLEDPTSSYIITGNEHLISGDNTVSVIVMNSDKSVSKTYQITVHKKVSSNNYLSDITVFDEETIYAISPIFDKYTSKYYTEVDYDVEKVTISAESESSSAIIQGIGEESLAYGLNERTIYVTAEDGSVNSYLIQIYRNYNLYLKDIVSDIGTLTPTFDPTTFKYNITVDNEEEEITFIAMKSSSEVKVTGNGDYILNTGDNEINFVVTAPDGKTKTYTVIVTRGSSDNNYIENLLVHEGVIEPEFDKNTSNYEVSVRNTLTSVNIDVELEDANATYEIIGNKDLKKGSNIVTIRVTAENGDIRDYTIDVILQEDSYFSNRLVDLSITNGKITPDFDPDINSYAATVSNSVIETTIEVIKESVDAQVTGIGKVTLNEGRNVFQIQVTSKDGIVNTYTLIIYRTGNSDATLSSLVVKNHNFSPIFNKLEESYELTVGSETTSLEVEAIPTDSNATVQISGHKNIETGDNTVTILVTAADGITHKKYTIKVTKTISSNNYLSSLKVNGYTLSPEFNKSVTGPYVVNVETDINSIVVEAEPEVETTKVIGTGKYDLSTGQNIVNVTATSESGDARIYTLIINKAKNSDSSLKDIIISDGSLNPSFDSTTLTYTVDAVDELTEITVTGVTNSTTSTVKGNGTYTLNDGNTLVELVVTAEDGSKTTYQVTIRKSSGLSSKLSNLVIKEGEISPSFHKNTEAYTVKVPYEVTSLDMIITPEDSTATYEVFGNQNFVLGTNTVTITVTSSDRSSTTDYNIFVTRQSNSSNYLKDLSVTGYELNPIFNKTILYYEVIVPNSQENITINATLEDTSATVTGTGVKTLAYGENRFYVNVTSKAGIVRTYSIVVTRSLDEENLLLTLTPSIGKLDKEFDPYTNEYTLTVPEKTESVTLTGTSSNNTTTVGLEKVSITDFEIEHSITVTSQTGKVNVYTIKIVKPASSNTELDSLIPSTGILNYSNDILDYEMEVEDNISVISFIATPTDEGASIKGTDLTILNYGENEITIIVTAEDKVTTRTINIKVIRNKEIGAIKPNVQELYILKEETKQVTYKLEPSDTTYQEVEWQSLNENIATVDQQGNITGVSVGTATIKIISKHNPKIVASITVNVIDDEITSSIYDIYHDTEVEYVIGIESTTKLSDFIMNFDNNPSSLHIYDQNGIEITDTETLIGSYMTIKLIINETIYDELVIAVRGDLDGDSYVTAVDLVEVKNLILGTSEETFLNIKLADIDLDDYITAVDLVSVKQYILGSGTLN